MEGARVGSEVLITGSVVVFLALSALYSFERRQRAKVGALAHETASRAHHRDAAPAARAAGRHPIERLLAKKPAATPAARRAAHPESAPARPEEHPPGWRNGHGARESGEESFSVAGPDVAAPCAEPSQAQPSAPPPAAAEPRPAPAAAGPPAQSAAPPPPAAQEKPPPPGPLDRCAALRAAGRFDEAAHAARGGLARAEADPGPLLIELSHAELGLGRVNAAVDTARDAHFVSRSRESVRHLIWVLTETRRFVKEDGDALRRAVRRHPGQPLLRRAAGVYESVHGEPAAAVRELRAALRLEVDPGRRRAIERDLARVRRAQPRRRRSERG